MKSLSNEKQGAGEKSPFETLNPKNALAGGLASDPSEAQREPDAEEQLAGRHLDALFMRDARGAAAATRALRERGGEKGVRGPDGEKKSLGRLAEVNPAVAAKLAHSTGKDVGDAEVKVEPDLEASGKRGVAREGREIAVGSELAARDARLMAHEAAHVVQQRGGAEKSEGTPVGETVGPHGVGSRVVCGHFIHCLLMTTQFVTSVAASRHRLPSTSIVALRKLVTS